LIRLTDTKANEVEILCLMLKDKQARLEALSDLKEHYFSIDLHRRLFRTIEVLTKYADDIDLTLTIQKMQELGLKQDGDMTAIAQIYGEFSSSATLKRHIENLINGYKSNEYKRKMVNYICSVEVLDTDEVINNLTKIIEDRKAEDVSTLILQEWLLNELSERMVLDKPKPLGLLTGYRDLDKIIRGIVPGSIVTILARSGIGKTTFSTELLKKIAFKNKSITYFSLEMPPEQIYLKMVLAEADLKVDDYISITKDRHNVVDKLAVASSKISALNLRFSQEMDVRKIINLINFYVRKEKIKVFFIDYLNIVKSDITTNNTDILYNQITAELKQVALKTGAVIFLITQANKAVDSQQDKRPNLKDIKSSSSIEQNSDYIIALYRNLDFNSPGKTKELLDNGRISYGIPNADINPECFELIVLKNRHTGECGTVYLRYSQSLGYLNWNYL
jgi:replicative DNA helicase